MSARPEDLGLHDQLSLWIGRVARADVQVESHLRYLWINLTGPSLAIWVVPTSFATLVEQCRVLLREHPYPPERLRVAGDAALLRASERHRKRNRDVHDMWIPTDDGSAFTRQQTVQHQPFGRVTRRTIADLERTYTELQRSVHEIGALSLTIPFLPEVPIEEHTFQFVEGRFTLLPEGGARPEVWDHNAESDPGE